MIPCSQFQTDHQTSIFFCEVLHLASGCMESNMFEFRSSILVLNFQLNIEMSRFISKSRFNTLLHFACVLHNRLMVTEVSW